MRYSEVMEQASCLGVDPDIFIEVEHREHAKRLCNGTRKIQPCPARAWCLRDALERGLNTHEDGMRGGVTPRERQRMRIKQSRNQIVTLPAPVSSVSSATVRS